MNEFRPTSSYSGFTLVEILVSSTIFLGVLSIALQYGTHTQRLTSGQNTKMQAQAILTQILSKVKGSSGDFPALVAQDGSSLVYVGCFDRSGTQLPINTTIDGSTSTSPGFIGVAASDSTQAIRLSTGSLICKAPAVEVHLQPTQNPNEVKATAILITTGAEDAPSSSKILTTKTFSVVTKLSSSL